MNTSMMTTNVLEYLEDSALHYSEKKALTDEFASVTYGEYMLYARKIGTFLAKQITDEQINKPVAVLIDRTIMSIITFMGIVYSGNFYVPIDISMPKERVNLIIDTLQPVCILDARKKGADYEGVYKVDEVLAEGEVDVAVLDKIRSKVIDTDPLYAIFTSGSTGTPKGVTISHKSVIDLCETFGKVFEFGNSLVWGNQAPFDFDVSVKDIYNAMRCGGEVVVIPKKCFMMPKILISYLNEKKVNTLIWAVSALRIVSEFKTFEEIAPPNLQYVMFSGEVMPVKSLNYWREYVPQARYVNLYGPTEITCNCTYYEVTENFREDEALPIGKAFPNSRVFLLDDEGKQVSAKGQLGEICVEGTCVGLGYWNNQQRTAEAFCQNALTPEYRNCIYRTGDLASYDEKGNLIFASRKDYQIKHMGHRIELGEIEVALNAIEHIDVACCIYDEVHEKIVCCYQAKEENTKKIVAELGKKLPKYMWPNKYLRYEKLPMNKNGKIDRVALKRKCVE